MNLSTLPGPRDADLPEPVAHFVRAVNLFDLEELVDSFASDALVNDQLRDFWGREAIGRWAQAEVVGEHMTIHVADVLEHHGDIIVTAHVDGDFDKSGLPDPLVLAFHFRVEHDRIVRLIILSNLDAQSPPAVRQNLSAA
jgi:hypothetical protein